LTAETHSLGRLINGLKKCPH